MMRITNAMMTSNTKNNINLNKLNEDRLNTQIATGQVISRPSEDPVVAIRALRLNTNLSQLTQYYKKNIPDAQAWLNVTETALKQTDQIFTNIKENLTAGASDNHTATDRQKILENLKGLRAELYSSGNADYAERTVFTDYRTQESLTFLETDTDLNIPYDIHEEFDVKELESIKHITTYDSTVTTLSPESQVDTLDIKRIRLAYDNLGTTQPGPKLELHYSGSNGATPPSAVDAKVFVDIMSTAGKTQQEIDQIYASVKTGGKNAVFIPETGEILLSDTVADLMEAGATLKDAKAAWVNYSKNEWKSGDLRPEHYFACKQNDPKGTKIFNCNLDTTGKPNWSDPNFQNKNMEVEISFNQKITINTHANEVYTHDIGRDIDELIKITQDVVDCDEKVTDLEKKIAAETDAAKKQNLELQLDAAKKEYSLKKDRMQKAFSGALDTFAGYADRNNLAIANIGSMQSRLTITKERVADQLQSFKELADANINAELTESSIDFANAKLALEAAQLAAGKIAQQTLLNYL